MDIRELEEHLTHFVELADGNFISREQAIEEELIGLQIYGAPLLGSARADDPLFQDLKKTEAIGPHFMLPSEWMEGGYTVISFFLPYTREIKKANTKDNKEPAAAWLHGRVEGHEFLIQACGYLKSLVEGMGGTVLVPGWDERFWRTETPKGVEMEDYGFTSTWSERHVGFICGLGTFGLSKGLITKAGIAGRLASMITDLEFVPTDREYEGLYDYCSNCGLCIQRCPVNAISFEKGKAHEPCGKFMDYTKVKYAPRYGCGKCQTGVPCESGVPVKR